MRPLYCKSFIYRNDSSQYSKHLRYGQDTYLDTLNWDKQLTGIVGLVLAIYQRCGTRIEATCSSNDAWHNIDFSKNG